MTAMLQSAGQLTANTLILRKPEVGLRSQRRQARSRREMVAAVVVAGDGPPVMVNSCTGKVCGRSNEPQHAQPIMRALDSSCCCSID